MKTKKLKYLLISLLVLVFLLPQAAWAQTEAEFLQGKTLITNPADAPEDYLNTCSVSGVTIDGVTYTGVLYKGSDNKYYCLELSSDKAFAWWEYPSQCVGDYVRNVKEIASYSSLGGEAKYSDLLIVRISCESKTQEPAAPTTPITPTTPGEVSKEKVDIREYDLQLPIGELSKLSPPTTKTITEDGEQVEIVVIPWIAEYIGALYKYLALLGAFLAVLMLMIGGVGYMLGGANPQMIGRAKETMFYAVFGVTLILGSYTLLNVLNPDLINLKSTEIEAVQKVEMICCQDDEISGQTSLHFAGEAGESLSCPQGSSLVNVDKCGGGAMSIGRECCLDPNSQSYKQCNAIGGFCLPVPGEGPCVTIAETVGVSAAVSVAVIAVGPAAAANVAKGAVQGAKLVGKNLVKIAAKCTTSRICIGGVGTAAVLLNDSILSSSCSDEIGICTQVGGIGTLSTGDMCLVDAQCAGGGVCCPTLEVLKCWGNNAGFCSSGLAGPANSDGTGICPDEQRGKSDCCFGDAQCLYYVKESWLLDQDYGRCSAGNFGHACGGNEAICTTNGLVCNPNGYVCVSPDGFIPEGQENTIPCGVDSNCLAPSAPANSYCPAAYENLSGLTPDNSQEIKNCVEYDKVIKQQVIDQCLEINTPAFCTLGSQYVSKGIWNACYDKYQVSVDFEDLNFCKNKHSVGESCKIDEQCLSDKCENSICVCNNSKGCKGLDEVCIDAGAASQCLSTYTTGNYTLNTQMCFNDANCLYDSCTAKIKNQESPTDGMPVCDCNDDEQCTPGAVCRNVYSNKTCFLIADLKKAGEACYEDAECYGEKCESGVCVCTLALDCPADYPYCVKDKCRSGKVGSYCEKNTDCLATNVCADLQTNFGDLVNVGICIPQPISCTVDNNCKVSGSGYANADCEGGYCDCDYDSECESGAICIDAQSGNDPCVFINDILESVRNIVLQLY